MRNHLYRQRNPTPTLIFTRWLSCRFFFLGLRCGGLQGTFPTPHTLLGFGGDRQIVSFAYRPPTLIDQPYRGVQLGPSKPGWCGSPLDNGPVIHAAAQGTRDTIPKGPGWLDVAREPALAGLAGPRLTPPLAVWQLYYWCGLAMNGEY